MQSLFQNVSKNQTQFRCRGRQSCHGGGTASQGAGEGHRDNPRHPLFAVVPTHEGLGKESVGSEWKPGGLSPVTHMGRNFLVSISILFEAFSFSCLCLDEMIQGCTYLPCYKF